MAANELAVLSLANAKAELRIEASDTDGDALVTRHVKAAVSFVEGRLGRALVRASRQWRVPCPGGDREGIAIWAPDLDMADASVALYPSTASDEGAARRTIPKASITAWRVSDKRHWYQLLPASGGWGDRNPSLPAVVSAHVEMDPIPLAVEQAVARGVVALYDGVSLSEQHSLLALLRPHRAVR